MRLRTLMALTLMLGCGHDEAGRAGDTDLAATDTAPTNDTAPDTAPDAAGEEVDSATDAPGPAPLPLAFFYQDVAPTGNRVRIGATRDGLEIDSFDREAATWTVFGATQVFGDPTFSRLGDGRWAMTATASPEDPRGGFALLYYEDACPMGVPAPSATGIKAILASNAPGCRPSDATGMAKASQLFSAYGSTWLFISNSGAIVLVRVSDGDHGAGDLAAICLLPDPVTRRDALAVGDAGVVLPVRVTGPIGDGATTGPLLLSDAAIARRSDGTWVLFVKGISEAVGCSGGGLCELCNRGIYRATSSDLVTWSALERVAFRASVPDAVTRADGTVWLYWQDFTPTCEAGDLHLAARAPILAAYERDDFTLSAPTPIRFPDEPFETDTRLHYPTNANPVALPDAAAASAFEACLGR